MLYLDKPIGPLKGLQIYRDHADPNQFYYISERPRLAMNDDVPEFIFLKYARDITDNPDFDETQKNSLGGGLLAFTVDLSVDQKVLDEVKGDLGRYSSGGPVALTPVIFESGEVRLSIIKQGEDNKTEVAGTGGLKIFEETWGATKPSLYGNNRATFGIALSQEGSTLMEESLKRGIGFVGVVYDLKFLGMRPSYHAKVTADYKRVYNHFEAQLGATGTIQVVQLAADLAFGYQKLEDDGVIKVEVTTFTDDKDLKQQADEAVKWAREKITEDLFKSSLNPPSFMQQSNRDLLSSLLTSFASSLGGSVSSVQPNPRTSTPPAQPSKASATSTGSTTSGSTTSTGTSTTGTSTGTTTGNTTSGATGTGTGTGTGANSTISDSSTGQSRSVLGIQPGGLTPAGNHVDTISAQRQSSGTSASRGGSSGIAPFKIALSLKYYRQEELKKRTFEFSRQSAEIRSAAPQGLFSTLIEGYDLSDRIISINLDDEMFKRLIADVGVVCDWDNDGVELVNISLEYPGVLPMGSQPSHVDGYVFTKSENQRKVFTTWLNALKDMSYRYKADVHFKSTSQWVGKESVLHGDWQTTRNRQMIFNPLDEIGLLNVKIALDETVDFKDVTQVLVQTEYDDPENDFKVEHSFILNAQKKTDEWKLRLSNRYHRSIRWRAIYSLPDNIETSTDWTTTDETSVIVSEPFQGLRHIRVVPTLKGNEIIEAILDLEYEETNGYKKTFQEVFTPENLKGRNLTIDTLLKNPGVYLYTITVVRSDGSVYVSDETESDSGVIIVDDKDGQIINLNIKMLISPAQWEKLYAVELQIRTPDGNLDSLIFTTSQPAERQYVFGLAADAPLEYEWRTLAYPKEGARNVSEFHIENDKQLVATVE
jgi:hypothetical protein